MHSVFTHTPAPPRMGERERDGSTAESTQPFCNTSRNFPSSPCMRNRWGGAIKWICCYFPRLLAEDVKPQPRRQPRMTADSGRGERSRARRTLCHAHDQLSCYCVIYQIAWACDEWATDLKREKKRHLFCIRLLLCPCNSLGFNYSKW